MSSAKPPQLPNPDRTRGGIADPFTNPSAWDTIKLGGQPNPGLAIVGQFKRVYPWDKKQGKGVVGTVSTLTGIPAIRGVKIVFQLWTRQHFIDWANFVQLFQYDPDAAAAIAAIDIEHPSLVMNGPKAVLCESITNPVHKGNGLYEIEVELSEYLPVVAKAAVKTVDLSGTTAPAGTSIGPPVGLTPDEQRLLDAENLNKSAWGAGGTP
jgi:hypothetical protein